MSNMKNTKVDNKIKGSYRSYKKQQMENSNKNSVKFKNKNNKISKKTSKKQTYKEKKEQNLREKIIKKQEKKLKKKKNRDKIKKNILKSVSSDSFFVVIMIVLIVAFLSVITYNQSKIATIKYSINKKKIDMHNLDNEIKVEKIKIDESSRSDIIEKRAIEELGMQYRQQEQIEYIKVD